MRKTLGFFMTLTFCRLRKKAHIIGKRVHKSAICDTITPVVTPWAIRPVSGVQVKSLVFFMDSTQNSCGLDFTTRHVRSAKKILNSGVGLGFDIKASLAIQRSWKAPSYPENIYAKKAIHTKRTYIWMDGWSNCATRNFTIFCSFRSKERTWSMGLFINHVDRFLEIFDPPKSHFF